MPNNRSQSEAYQRQARSDYQTATLLRQPAAILSRGKARCHTAAMCQQVVEKSVKSLYLAMGQTPRRTHQVGQYIAIIMVEPLCSKFGNDVRRTLSRIFSPSARQTSESLSALVPKSKEDDPGQTRLNTEYPFFKGDDWVAPCDDSAFHEGDIDSLFRETGRILDGTARVCDLIHRIS
ncbi:MAG: HEPN domain-containing protein [Chthoniobacteraceae bacterium]